MVPTHQNLGRRDIISTHLELSLVPVHHDELWTESDAKRILYCMLQVTKAPGNIYILPLGGTKVAYWIIVTAAIRIPDHESGKLLFRRVERTVEMDNGSGSSFCWT